MRLTLKTPSLTDEDIYIAGTFNNWKAPDPNFKLNPVKPGLFAINLPENLFSSGKLQYKYLKKNWENVEVAKNGNEKNNRTIVNKKKYKIDHVSQWRNETPNSHIPFLPIIEVISHKFHLTDAVSNRRISILLPYNYNQTNKNYPVIYLMDGQNLHEDTAPFGTWAIDKKLSQLASDNKHEIIIVAIDHGENNRIKEFLPYATASIPDPQGKQFATFVIKTLKPFIDQNYRTKSSASHTGIGGSSMGALISAYIFLKNPNHFTKLLLFSPSFWISPQLIKDYKSIEPSALSQIYLYAGIKESKFMITDINKFLAALKTSKNSEYFRINTKFLVNGKHNESTWGNQFPFALNWLFF